MNRRTIGVLAMTFALAPVSVLAQTDANPPPPPGAVPPPPMAHPDRDFSQMRQMHEQFEKIHTQERSSVLGALTPEHRELVARILGELGVSANPNPRDAASRIDAALSPSEKSAILSAHQTAMTQMHSAMQQLHAQMSQQGGPSAPQMMEQHKTQHQPTAGDVVLRVSGAGGHDMMFMRQHP